MWISCGSAPCCLLSGDQADRTVAVWVTAVSWQRKRDSLNLALTASSPKCPGLLPFLHEPLSFAMSPAPSFSILDMSGFHCLRCDSEGAIIISHNRCCNELNDVPSFHHPILETCIIFQSICMLFLRFVLFLWKNYRSLVFLALDLLDPMTH